MPNSDTGDAPVNPSCTITSLTAVLAGTLSTVIVCVGEIGSAAVTLETTLAATFRFVVSVGSYTWIVCPTYTSAAPEGTVIVNVEPLIALIVPSTPLPAVWITLSRNDRNCFMPLATSRLAAFLDRFSQTL